MLVHLGDQPVPHPEHEHVVVGIGLALTRPRVHRHLDEDVVARRRDRVVPDLHRRSGVVEPHTPAHQLENGLLALVAAAHRRALGRHPDRVLAEQRGNVGVPRRDPFEVAQGQIPIAVLWLALVRLFPIVMRIQHAITIASWPRSKGARLLRSPLLHFLFAGGLLFALQAAWSRVPESDAAEPPRIEVARSEIDERIDAYRRQMGRLPSEAEARAIESQVIENALWLEQAFAIGLHEVDSVVRQRLILNMRFLEGESEATDAELVDRAIELGMDKSDTVVQRRLIDRVQAIIRARVRANPPDEETLEAHFRATREQWREAPLLDLSHVYLSRDRRGEKTRADASALLARLQAEALDPETAIALADPFLAGHRLRGATPNRIIARLGPDFAAGVADAPTGRWIGPVESAFGQHLVWIHERLESRIPELSEIRPRVLEDWIEQESRKALREHIEARRQAVQVEILEDSGAERPNATAS